MHKFVRQIRPGLHVYSASMGSVEGKRYGVSNRREEFATTRWSIVIAAGRGESSLSRDALSLLCKTYWYPLYAYARRRGYRADQAEDVTQSFFARFLEKKDVQDADRSRGKFRSFLLVAFKHFLANEYDRERAQKRGGQHVIVPLNLDDAERKFNSGLVHGATPDQEYEKQWALSVLDGVVAQLTDEYAAVGKADLFGRLRVFLPGATGDETYQACGAALSLSESAVKMAVHRMRKRYRHILRKRIADTLADPAAVDEEIRYLLDVLST